MAMNVPINAYINTEPIFLKNGFLFMLYPLSKIIGGRSKIMNKFTKLSDNFKSVSSMSINRRAKPVNIPINVVRPAS